MISGEITADDTAAARDALASQGLQVQTIIQADAHATTSAARLSPADALQLTAQLADLTVASAPLEAGLRALSQDLPRSRLRTAIERLAGHLERGVPLDAAAGMPDVRLPAHVRALIAGGMQSGRLDQVLERFLEHQQFASDMRRQLWSGLAYPALLLVLLAGWCTFVMSHLLPTLLPIYREMDITLPASTQLLLQLAKFQPHALILLTTAIVVGILLRLGLRRAAAANLLAGMPLFGQLWRNIGLAEACSLLSLLLESSVPLATALEITSDASRDGGVAEGCRTAAGLAAAGRPWSECLAQCPPFPQSVVPLAAWGERQSAQPEAMATAAQLLRVRVEQRAQVLRMVLPPVIFLGMTAVIIFFTSALFSPLLRVIRALSWWQQTTTAQDPDLGILTGSISLMLLGLTLLFALRVLGLKESSASSDPLSLVIDTAGWILITFGSLLLYCGLAGGLGFTLWLGSLIIAFISRLQWNRLRQRSHLALLAAAAAKQIPLVDCARAFGEEQRGSFRRQVLKFAAALEQGTPLADAIRQQPRALPRSSQLAASVGQQSGRLPAALQEDAAGLSTFDPLRQAFGARLLYLSVVLLFVQLPVLFTFIKIMPSVRRIFLDFEVPLPALTRWVMDLSHEHWFHLLLILVTLLWPAILLWGVAWYTGWAAWLPPGMRRWLLRFDRSTILRALAHPAENRQPLEPMIQHLAAGYPRRWVRKRLARAHQLIAAGHNWVSGLRLEALLGQADAAVLEAAQRAGNLAWALREMADSNQRRLIYRLQALLQIGSVLLVLSLGASGLLIALTVFEPLVVLTSELAHVH